MKVLFLDIDGVLNRRGTKERCGSFMGVDRELSAKFLKWFNKTDPNTVEIVLSSTWRLHPDMWQHLRDAGIRWSWVTKDSGGRPRGDEIQHWLDQHPEVTSYAILDDIEFFTEKQMPYLVRTNQEYGITDENIQQLTKLLG